MNFDLLTIYYRFLKTEAEIAASNNKPFYTWLLNEAADWCQLEKLRLERGKLYRT